MFFVWSSEGTENIVSYIILDSSMVEHSAVNRVVVGSSPTRGVFLRPHGQAVKTSPFHGGNTGSIPVGVTEKDSQKRVLLSELSDRYIIYADVD